MRLLYLALLTFSLVACSTDTQVSANTLLANSNVRQLARVHSTGSDEPQFSEFIINSNEINESSDLARSHRNPNLLWTHNDSGGETAIYALTTEGAMLASVHLKGIGVVNLDWEDMASFSQNGKAFLLVGDIGDNMAFRPTLTYYLLEEPEIEVSAPGPQRLVAEVIATYTVRLPDAPRDIESLAVDASSQTAYMISKRDNEPALYSFSLARPIPGVLQAPLVATNLGKINIPRAPADYPRSPETYNWVTSMDISANGLAAYVGTLSHGYRYVRRPEQTWQEAFGNNPEQIALPPYTQIEAGAFASDSDSDDEIYITSENLPGRLAQLRFNLFH